MNRTLAPSGSPIHLRDLFDCILQIGQDSASGLRTNICTSLGVKEAFLFANGRGAMSFLLQCMAKERNEPRRDLVVVPSYTCYSVAASVLKAGLRLLICDIDEKTLSYDQEQLESIDYQHVLAIVSSNLYGLPNDLPKLEALARNNGVYLIDDAAQSLGATVENRPVGSFGDAGILSLDKGKVITSINGGVIITSNTSISQRIKNEYQRIGKQSLSGRTIELIKLQAYFLLLHPAVYWLPAKMPFLALGKTRYDEKYSIERYFDSLAPLAIAQLSRMESMNHHRRRCAAQYAALIPKTELLGKAPELKNSVPIYLRFPLRIKDARTREAFLQDFRQFGCSVSYPTAIPDIPEIRHRIRVHNNLYESGKVVAAQLVTLPTHRFVRDSDIEQICLGLSTASTVPGT